MPNSVYLYLYLCCMVWLSCQSYGVNVQCTCTVCLHCTALSCIYGMYCLVCSFLQQYSLSMSVFIGLQGIARQLYYSGCLYVSISFKFCLSVSLCYICCLSVSLHYTVHGVCQFVIYSKYMVFVCQFALYIWYISVYQLKLYLASICYGL